ncbi:hypothetical protein [Streptomyces rishiriensis]|uniref:hypothetical protein n=1 Tax=Streptomyces rishiriensis TaxID=68264 RepID=UPI00131F1B5D|nr:hypothetical protein [Streptomyces rishiriensis]
MPLHGWAGQLWWGDHGPDHDVWRYSPGLPPNGPYMSSSLPTTTPGPTGSGRRQTPTSTISAPAGALSTTRARTWALGYGVE